MMNVEMLEKCILILSRYSVNLLCMNSNRDVSIFLVATDIVSRGIDIDDIRLVINFDVPHDSEDYVHRIGRTARANNDGVALTFVNEKEQTNFKNIENFLEKEIYKIPVPAELGEAPQYNPRSYTNAGRGGRNFRNGNRKNNNGGRSTAPDRAEDKRKAFLPFFS